MRTIAFIGARHPACQLRSARGISGGRFNLSRHGSISFSKLVQVFSRNPPGTDYFELASFALACCNPKGALPKTLARRGVPPRSMTRRFRTRACRRGQFEDGEGIAIRISHLEVSAGGDGDVLLA